MLYMLEKKVKLLLNCVIISTDNLSLLVSTPEMIFNEVSFVYIS